MIGVYLILGVSLVAFGALAVTALVWAARTGQFENFKAGSESIFDAAEPIGEPTDLFPDIDPRRVPSVLAAARKGPAKP